jgi:hypothetical protein
MNQMKENMEVLFPKGLIFKKMRNGEKQEKRFKFISHSIGLKLCFY